MKRFSLTLLMYLFALTSWSQINSHIDYEAGLSATFGSNDRAPFWLTANRYGMGSTASSSGYARAGINGEVIFPRHWRIDAGITLAGGWHMPSDVWIQECHADVSWKMLRLSFGSKEANPFPLDKNMNLSTGWMTEGINARPIPQVRFDIKDYLSIPWLGNWLALKGHIAYGKFADTGWKEDFTPVGKTYVADILYHSKSLMFRIGKEEKLPLTFEFGLQMATQFGGKIYKRLEDDEKELVRKMPTGPRAYWAALVPQKGGKETVEGEQVNVEGNMLGSWIFGLNYQLDDWTFRVHYDHFFEDHSQMFWEYGRWKDGQIGIEVTLPHNKWVSHLLWEGINTTDQTGPFLYDAFEGTMTDAQTSGNDDYYNHYIYDGWQHQGMSIGNPLLMGAAYNNNHDFSFVSNRIRANHIGISGNPSDEWRWRLLATHTLHWGTYSMPLDKVRKQFSGMLEVSYLPKWARGWKFSATFALDNGNYLKNSAGGMIAVSKCGSFGFGR